MSGPRNSNLHSWKIEHRMSVYTVNNPSPITHRIISDQTVQAPLKWEGYECTGYRDVSTWMCGVCISPPNQLNLCVYLRLQLTEEFPQFVFLRPHLPFWHAVDQIIQEVGCSFCTNTHAYTHAQWAVVLGIHFICHRVSHSGHLCIYTIFL